ncbi:hypothetical protein [Simiduia aestuariiviva]|uniref:Uncharacterized protein n=1 Tax=Simiduia aestuariiviva TaxID=1510459 RepID=A0A839UHQ5_9GAMM|nr:hypothetical protein [Simiduia aestuariiviva]MBB3167003.1 hypothetical protein [Simiduia aestuariiviva]
MDYFMQFHWWYLFVVFIVLFMFNGKGGVVVRRLSAPLKSQDARFDACRAEAHYVIFKVGKPDKIDIELKNLSIPQGSGLGLSLNNASFAAINVRRNGKAKFEHWTDEPMTFPVIQLGDELAVKYQGQIVLSGVFRADTADD